MAWDRGSHPSLVICASVACQLARDTIGAEALLKKHHEHRTEIEARQGALRSLEDRAEPMLAAGNPGSEEVRDRKTLLETQMAELNASLARRHQQLVECQRGQAFTRLADQADAWIATREGLASNEDYGDTLDGVEALLKKHGDFEKSLAAQQEKINEVEREAEKLVAENHYNAEDICVGARRRPVCPQPLRRCRGLCAGPVWLPPFSFCSHILFGVPASSSP